MMAHGWQLKNPKSQTGEATQPEMQLWTWIYPEESEPWSSTAGVHGWGYVVRPDPATGKKCDLWWNWQMVLFVWGFFCLLAGVLFVLASWLFCLVEFLFVVEFGFVFLVVVVWLSPTQDGKKALFPLNSCWSGSCSTLSWAGTQLGWLWGHMCHTALVFTAPSSSQLHLQLRQQELSLLNRERVFHLLLLSTQTRLQNFSCQVTPQSPENSATKEHEPWRWQIAICGQHLHDPKLVRLFASCSWERHMLWANALVCLTGTELTNRGCNVSINGGKEN